MFKKKCPSTSMSSLGSDGNTSFLRAARAGHLEKVLEHLQSNIDINTSNANGLNALHLASKDGHVEVVTELLKRGAVVDSATKKGNTALHIASLAGQEDVVKLLVQHGASVNVQSQNGFTPLYMAAQENHDSVVKYLLANGANQSLATEDGFTPLAVAMQQGHDKVVAVLLENDTRGKVRLPALHIAAKKDDVKAAKLLLENEHNPDVTSKSGFTPLHIASHYGNEGIANLLIQKGADVNYAAKHNITPLHVAAKWGKTNMVALLLEKGANIESKTRDGLTPLHCAARSGHEQVVDMLLERGAPISSKTKNGLAPLHMAAQGDHVDAARILLYHRAPVDEVTVDYLTALHVAAHCGHARVAKLLLDRQADANARALNGFTPLHIACKKNRIKVVELLLKHGASIGATTESGLTPLHVASFMGCMNIVIYLLQHEANPDVPTVRGETPLHLAARANQTDIIRILLRNGAQVDARAREQQTPLHIASRLGNVDIVMLLLQHGAQVDTTTKDMYTALHIAAKEGQDEVAAVLLDHGASLTATTKKGFTPLHLAAKYGNMKVAKLLLQKEAPVDAQGKNGVTPLHVASHYDHQNVALLLLDKGASPHATAKNGHTPLHIAGKKNQMDIATTLLEYGAQANAESKAGFTPLHLSAQEGHTDMSSLLIEHQADTNHYAKNGLIPLHLCAQEDRVDVAHILVKNGTEIDAVTKAGYTPLHVASHFGQINMVRFLLQNGADVKTTTSIGYTPLHQAAQQGQANVVNMLLEHSAQPNAITNNGQTPLQIAQKLGYISVAETLKVVTKQTTTPILSEEKYKVVAPEAMHETFMSDSEEEGGEDTMLADQPYRYLTVDEMKSLGDDSLPIDVTRDERVDSNRMASSGDITMLPPQAIEDNISPQHLGQNYSEFHSNKYTSDNIDIGKHPIHVGFLVSFLVDARGGAMRGCRHSGVRVIVPSRCAASPTRITCRYVKPQRTPHPPPLMEGEALASRVLELGPVGAKFLGPVILEVPHFAALRGKEREIVILRSDNGETWREHTVEASEEIVNDVLNDSFEAEDLSQLEDISSGRITRILTHDFPQYFAVVSRIRQEVHAIGPEGGMVSSTVVPQVQAVFPQGALTKKIKVGLQAQPIDPELAAKLLGHGVAVSPVVTVEPRRRKFHKAITLSMPAPRAHSQGMINQYSGSAPTLRLLCSITGGTTRAQWEDVTGSTPLTFVNDCVSFTTTVSARFWLMDCRNIGDATKMATELYREAIHVPFMAKFVVFAKRVDPLEARLRVFCMTDDKEDKTLEHQEHFTEVAKSRDVEVLEGKPQYIEFAGNLVPITKSGEQLQFAFRAFRENRLPFSVRVKDQHADTVGRCLFMREAKVAKGEPPQQPICILNIVLPDDIVAETISLTEPDTLKRHGFIKDNFYQRTRLSDMSNLLGDDWVPLAAELGLSTSEINVIKSEYPDSVAKQAQSMLRMWRAESGNKAQRETLEQALRRIGREDIIPQCLNVDALDHAVDKVKRDQGGFDTLKEELGPSRDASLRRELSLDTAVYERDIMKDSESVESLVQAEKKDPFESQKIRNIQEQDESKYSAEEKAVSDEEDFNKSVQERKHEIEKRLSEERKIPASTQRVEIVQEISSIKRQSIADEPQQQEKPQPQEITTETIKIEPTPTKITTTVRTVTTTQQKPDAITKTTVEKVKVTKTTEIIPDPELEKKLAAQKEKVEAAERTEKPQIDATEVTTTSVETRTSETSQTTTHITEPSAQDKRRDSELFEGVTQELERLETTHTTTISKVVDDLKSPKLSKTPPPSPADFILRDQTASIQEWGPAKGTSSAGESAMMEPTAVRDAAQQETSGGPLTKLTSEGSSHLTTNIDQPAELTPVPKPKPRVDRTPDSNKQFTTETEKLSPSKEPETDSTDTTESYFDRKKFWETVSSSKSEEERHEVSVKKRMSLYEENLFKQEQEKVIAKKRTSVHEIGAVPPVPKPRSTVLQTSSEESSSFDSQLQDITEVKEVIPEKPEAFVSEYKSAFKDPTVKPGSTKMEGIQISIIEDTRQHKKSESLDSETEYLKYEHQAYENPGYISESDHEEDIITSELSEKVPKVKRRQMSISQPPVAAARKTIFERSLSLPTEDLQDVNETSVKARKQFFEQQIKNDMVIDQLMTQFEEEEPQEYKTLSEVSRIKNIGSVEEKSKAETITPSIEESEKDLEIKEVEKKLSPAISSSSSQDTRTEDDITQYTPTSVKDLTRYFQPNLISDTISTNMNEEIKSTSDSVLIQKTIAIDTTIEEQLPKKQPSTESEQSISSERSIELGSLDDLPSQIADAMQYKSDSISKPGDSLEVHVDKSEIEESEKVTDMEQDGTDIEIKSLSAESCLSDTIEPDTKMRDLLDDFSKDIDTTEMSKVSPIREHQEHIVDTTWEVIESQPLTEIVESVTEIPIERQIIVEKDEELSGSVRDESDLGSEIHQDHSGSYESERVRSDHSEVEQLILESLYHQKINPEDARKIASELIDDIEAEIERRHLSQGDDNEDSDPPAPPAEVAKNQISDYLRQLAEAKGLDAKEVELVETVLARKQNELSKLGRRDTQTSSMEITDEDLKYSGEECDISPSESTENILEEQIEQLEFESKLKEKSSIDEEKFSEKSSDTKSRDIHEQHDRIFYEDESLVSVKADTSGIVETITAEQRDTLKKSEQVFENNILTDKTLEQKKSLIDSVEKTTLQTQIEVTTDSKRHVESADTTIIDSQKDEHIKKSSSTKKITDTGEVTQKTLEELDKKNIVLEGTLESATSVHEEIDSGYTETQSYETTKARGSLQEENENKIEHKQETVIAEDGSTIISEQTKERVHTKTVTTSEIVDHKREEKTSVQTFIKEIKDEPAFVSDDSKSSTYESAKSPEEQFSTSSSLRKDETETSNILEKPEVILRRTRIHRDGDTSSSSGNLRTDNRKSGADFEAYSSSGESHYHSFEQDSGRSRPCSSDVEGLMAAGSSEYESALTSQDLSSRSHITSTEYHTAVSSISSQSMKSLDSESSGNIASVEVSEASETLVASEVPSNFELEGDILDGAMSQLLEDEVVDLGNQVIEPYDREIPEHVIRGEYQVDDKKSSFDTISDSDIHGESMDISDEDDKNLPEVTGKMKRSQEMTFQPIPKAIIPDSPQSDNLEMDERFGTSLEDGSVLSMSLSSQSDATALRTVIEQSRRDSDRMDGSITISGHDSFSASNMSLDKIAPITTTAVDCATSTGFHAPDSSLNSVTLTTSIVDENGTQSVSTQVTSGSTTSDDAVNGPSQIDFVAEYDDVVEPKKTRGHRRTESTSTFNASMIPGFTPRTDVFKNIDYKSTESEKTTATEMTLKEVHHEEMKDVDEMEESYETEADQGYHRQQKESGILDTESDQDADRDENDSRPPSRISKTDSDDQRGMSVGISEDRPDSELIAIMQQVSADVFSEPIERPLTPEPPLDYEVRGSIDSIQSLPSLPTTPKSKICSSEKSSIEEGEAEAAFSMVAHVSPAHKAKGDICPIMEDEDAEKHELETRERAQKELEKRRAQILRDQSPGNIPDIMVTEHMTPLIDREFHYPDLELEEKEALEEKETLSQKSAPQTPASISSKSSEETDQGREYILEGTHEMIPKESDAEAATEDKQMTESKSEILQSSTVEEKTVYVSKPEYEEPISPADSPNSDSFEMLEKPDIIDDFVVIEEVAKEAAEHDTEGKSVCIQQTKYIRKHDEEVEEYLVRSAPTPLTRMTELKYYPEGTSSGDEVGPFDFEDSPPQAGKKSTGTKTTKSDDAASQSYAFEYDKELEASKKWIEMQFQGDQAAMISAGYGYEMEFERGPLEDIKEEEATDFESSRIGSLDSQKQSIGSLGSVKDSFSSTPEYDVLAGRKFFTRSGEHDDVSMSSLQEFENLERIISLENRRHHQGSQDSSSNGSFSKRFHASRSGQGDDVSLSSLKEFEGLESACIEAHQIELKAREEEASLAQIDEAQESLISESESCKSLSSIDKKNLPESEEEDYEKRMFEIDEIIKQAQSNVEKFIDMKDVVDKTESMGRGDSLEEVARVPDLELDEPLVKSTVHTVRWGTEDVMQTSTDSLEQKPEHRASIDSLDMKTTPLDVMTASTDSIEFQIQSKSGRENIMTDSIEIQDRDKSCMITSDSLELTPGVLMQLGQMSDSIDDDGSRIGAIGHDQSSSSGFSMGRDDPTDTMEIHDYRADYLLGSTDSLDPSSSTATHATYQYETDSVMSGSFTSGGSNTMVSSTDTIDNQAHGVDLAAAVRKVWFDEDAFGAGSHFTTELLDDGSKPFVTEVIEPCEDDPEYSHTIHRKVQLPPEIKKITFKGQDADLQLRQYIENFGEGEDVQETQETDKDGNIHVKRVVQKRFVVKSGPNGEEQRISGPELESYLQQVSHPKDEFDFGSNDPTDFGLTKQIRTDSDGTKTIYGQTFTTKYGEGQGEDSALKQLLTSIASDVTQSSTFSHQTITRHVDKQQEQPTGSSSTTFSGAAAASVLREEAAADDTVESSGSSQATPQHRSDHHQLSSEMKDLLEEMEKQTKH